MKKQQKGETTLDDGTIFLGTGKGLCCRIYDEIRSSAMATLSDLNPFGPDAALLLVLFYLYDLMCHLSAFPPPLFL